MVRNELFDVPCVKCSPVHLKFINEFDDENGGTVVYLFCPPCRRARSYPSNQPLLACIFPRFHIIVKGE